MMGNRDLLHGGPLHDGVYTRLLDLIDRLEADNSRLTKELEKERSTAKEFLAKYGHVLSAEELEELRIVAHNEIVMARDDLPCKEREEKTALKVTNDSGSLRYQLARAQRYEYQETIRIDTNLLKLLSSVQQAVEEYEAYLKLK